MKIKMRKKTLCNMDLKNRKFQKIRRKQNKIKQKSINRLFQNCSKDNLHKTKNPIVRQEMLTTKKNSKKNSKKSDKDKAQKAHIDIDPQEEGK